MVTISFMCRIAFHRKSVEQCPSSNPPIHVLFFWLFVAIFLVITTFACNLCDWDLTASCHLHTFGFWISKSIALTILYKRRCISWSVWVLNLSTSSQFVVCVSHRVDKIAYFQQVRSYQIFAKLNTFFLIDQPITSRLVLLFCI